MQRLIPNALKLTFTTHPAPVLLMDHLTPLIHPPHIGDLVAAEVISVRQHTKIENQVGVTEHIFPGDCIIGAFSNQYTTDQYEGYVPQHPVDECALLSSGGIFGDVASQHTAMDAPTRLRILGNVCSPQGQTLNLRQFGLSPCTTASVGEVILVLGATTNTGRAIAVGTVVRGLSRAGYRVATAKVTGVAAGKDTRYYRSCGANPVIDFVNAGYPATYMLGRNELLSMCQSLMFNLWLHEPDYIVVEIADGIFQRETRMLLESATFRATVDHVLFAAGDSMAMESGVRYLQHTGWPVRAATGAVTQCPALMREVEDITGLPCLSMDRILVGDLLPHLGRPSVGQAPRAATEQQVNGRL
jgi:hypothetical protein